MSSTYRIFIQDARVATAVTLDSGEFLQVYPAKALFRDQETWISDTFWVNRAANSRSYTLGLPDGSRVTYLADKYKLFHGGKCVSAGYRVGDAHMQRYPYIACGTRVQLISERAPLFGVETSLHVEAKKPVVTAAPEPKERVSRWAKMSDDERSAWVSRMRAARMAAKERRHASTDFVSAGNLIDPHKRKEYYEPNDANIHPAHRMILQALANGGHRVRRSY